MKKMLPALVLLLALPFSSMAIAANTHLMTIGVCPPWKKGVDDKQTALLRGACKTTLDTVEASFKDNMKLANDKVYRLLNEDATYSAVTKKMVWLNNNASADDTVFIYLLAHGGHLQGHYKGYPVTDQGIALWSVKEPNISTATDDKVFMLVRNFRDLIDGIKVKNIVLIVDSCHSGAAFSDFRDDPHQTKPSASRMAVVLSSRGDQFANFNLDYTMPIFSEMLGHSLKVSAGQPLSNAIELAATATHRRMKYNCRDPKIKKLISKDGELSYYSLCTQQAEVFDPYGLMDDITVK